MYLTCLECDFWQKLIKNGKKLPGAPGIEQGQRILLENLLLARFGTLDSELLNIIPSMLAQPAEEYTPLLLQLSREELINRFS